MINKLITAGFLLLTLFSITYFLFPKLARAHFLETDNSIGAILHIDPNDAPVTGRTTTFYFDIKDKTGKLTPENCKCVGKIVKDSQTIASTSLFSRKSATLQDAYFTHAFETPGAYEVVLAGNPTDGNLKPFNLTYVIRVEKGTFDSVSKPAEKAPFGASPTDKNYSILFFVGFTFIFVLIKIYIVRRTKKEGGEKA